MAVKFWQNIKCVPSPGQLELTGDGTRLSGFRSPSKGLGHVLLFACDPGALGLQDPKYFQPEA